ncbi:glycosyltransferase [bacterium]|nr:glycosyltransferase [bacterium]
MESNVAIFYHLAQIGQWKRLFQEQINSLVISGLYHRASLIHIGINGDDMLPMNLPKFVVNYNNNKILEADTLSSLQEFCLNNVDYKVMYFHTKGCTQEDKAYRYNVDGWRLYLEYFVIHRWKECLNLLDQYDTVGTEYGYETGLVNQSTKQTDWETNPHYQGNFWWATSNYISKLDKNYLYRKDKGWDRYRSEFWIGTGNPKRFNFYSTNIFSKYEKWGVSPLDYYDVDINMNKKAKFVMITMFKNEAKTIKRMLESCYKYIDYYVIQDNGSTDGTPQIVEDFFKDKDIPGFVYKCEQGWIGFGWNRDHLLQTCQNTNHQCDWIIKMDCDEILEVEDDFDWSVFDNKTLHAFHVTAIQGSTLYQRAWIWNAKLKWKFNHDTAHETIELLDDGIGANFRRHNLSRKFRQLGGFKDGESWQKPTKYITDALVLEEKMIRENTYHSDLYHFWYIGKSYYDSIRTSTFPLKEKHSKEIARRCIFNLQEYLNLTHNYSEEPFAKRIDEMGYYSMKLIANCYSFLDNNDLAELYYLKAEEFCPERNEHLYNLALFYKKINKFEMYLKTVERLKDPKRKNPFPNYSFILDSNCYYDTSKVIDNLYNDALKLNNKHIFGINKNMDKRLWVVDNFYEDPFKVREFALGVEYQEDGKWYKGSRSKEQHLFPGIKESFESIMGMKLKPFESHAMCGRFQILTAIDNLVYHYDSQKWAAMIYLTPDAPIESGTVLLKSKVTGARHLNDPNCSESFVGGFYDKTKFEVVDNVGNVFNRIVIMDANCIHAASQYFGQSKEDGRLTHLFFFDNEKV